MEFAVYLVNAVSLLVLVDVIASWVVSPEQFPRSLTSTLTEPLYRPFRMILPPEKMGGLDLSPMAVILCLRMLLPAVLGAIPPA
ncbi:MAG: YggT family protein [Myxococcota bacterium]